MTGSTDLDTELTHYRVGVVDLYLHHWAEGARLYTTAGETANLEEMAAHDGPVLLDGKFREIDQDGTIIEWHPWMGYCRAWGPGDEADEPALLLTEVSRID